MQYFRWPVKSVWRWVGWALLAATTTCLAGATGQPSQWISPARILRHHASHGYLGVEVADVTQQQAQTLHLDGAAGAEIVLLDHDAPAGKAGLHVHDVILASNGTKIRNAEQFRELLRQESSGKKLRLSVNRDGAVRAISVQLEDRRKVEQEAQQEIAQSDLPPGAQGFLSGGNVPSMAGGFHFWGLGSSFHVGALVEPMTPEMLDYLGLRTGVMVKSVARHSAADHAGLKPHDVILQVGSETVATTSDWERLLRASNGKVVTVAIQRENTRQTLWLQLNGKRH